MSSTSSSGLTGTFHLCRECDKRFGERRNLLKHESKVHGREKTGSKCVLCYSVVTTLENYHHHLFEKHDLQVDKEEHLFSNFEGFSAWKELIEAENNVYFIKKVRKEDGRSYFECNRSGHYKPQGKNIRSMKIKGTRKMGARCPAAIRLLETGERFQVIYFKTHAGHTNEMRHIDIPRDEREKIASQLALGLTRTTILQNIRATWTKENNKRIHRAIDQDLQNISRDFKLRSDVVRDQNDLVSVESHIEQMKSMNVNPIIIYEAEDAENQFILGICNEGQRFVLEKFGNDVIAMDSTHGTNDYNFQLTTIMVVDENRTGFSVAFLYSSKINQAVFLKFFRALKESCNVPRCKIFMSDDAPAYYNAWTEVFEPPLHRLLSIWHVFRNWNKHSLQISDIAKRKELMADIIAVQKNVDEQEFQDQAKFFMNKYEKDKPTAVFVQYFKDYYWNRVEQWALCHRKNLGINTNMFLENLHR
ncbi:uncharacterized protein LOC141857426 [Brevipalpus obovatus]|uniref:uncharacterized protein LOC141857426 n=1 Tax=Brevipalpus obovatus TaxID=246614 RepID=UPI003D9E8B76